MDQQLRIDFLANVIGSEKVQQLSNNVTSLNSTLLNAAAGATLFEKAVELGRAGVEKFLHVVEIGDSIAVMSEKTGIAASKLTQFQGAATQANLSSEQLEKGLKKFSASIGDVGNEKVSSAFKSLGISIKDTNGVAKDSATLLLNLSDKFKNMQDGSSKAAIAVSLFGKSGVDLIPLLNMGSKEIEKFNMKMGEDFPENARHFNDSLELTKKKMTEQSIDIINKFLPTINQIIDAYNSLDSSSSSGFGSSFRDGLKTFSEVAMLTYTSIVNGIQIVYTAVKSVITSVIAVSKEVWDILKGVNDAFERLANFDFKNVLSGFKVGSATRAWAEQFKKDFSDVFDDVSARSKNLDKFSSAIRSETLTPQNQKKSQNNYEYDSTLAGKLKKEQESIEKFKASQREQIELERQKIGSYALSSVEVQKNAIATQIRAQAEKDSAQWTNQSRLQLRLATDEIIKQRMALVDLQDQQKQSFSVGAKSAFKEYLESLRDVAKQTEQMFTRAFSGMEDALVDFVKSGQLNFKKFVDQIISDLVRLSVRQAMLGAIAGVSFASTSAPSGAGGAVGQKPFAFADGGIMSSSGPIPLRKYATGGIASSPQIALFGEGSTPEAFIPLPDGRSVPVKMKGAGGSSVVVNVQVNAGTGQVSSLGAEGKQLGAAIGEAVKKELVLQMRPGGLLSGGRNV